MRYKEWLEGVVLNAPEEIEAEFMGAGFSNRIGSTKPGFTLLFVMDRAKAEARFKPTTEAVERYSLL